MDHLIRTYEMIQKIENPSEYENDCTSGVVPHTTQDNELPSTSKGAYHKLTLHVRSLAKSQSATRPIVKPDIKQKLVNLCVKGMKPFDTNVLEYWRKFYRNECEMLKLAEVVLAVPATQVSVERAFSALSTILTKLRTKLSKKSLSNLLITKLNFDILHFSKLEIEENK
ncbi:PREDICTED: uncharacterized protein LOC108381145 [Rhagoletis zephyria]|uniref:uncharacterized protein LOC108381145 n=1 Tax=Rhagoletis zephyria TaxID=28612 RepID=UPI000811473C|nr:PREDICTED: uncharacterized protein LOC108381145 [Rhagoletis zephyria]